MKVISIVVIAMMIASSCLAIEELRNKNVTHIIIPKDEHLAIYQWNQGSQGYARIEACYGEKIVVYAKRTSDISPETDAPYATFSKTIPIYEMNFTAHWYYGFYVEDASNQGPEGINGALDTVISTDEEELKNLIPETPKNVITIKLSMSSGSATLTWQSTGVDNTKIYRKDIKKSDYSKESCFPPASYYMTGCSAKLWMNIDEKATDAVQIQHSGATPTGLVQVDGIEKNTVTLVGVLTEKNLPDPFVRAYDLAALSAASTTILSTLALVLLFLSVLLI